MSPFISAFGEIFPILIDIDTAFLYDSRRFQLEAVIFIVGYHIDIFTIQNSLDQLPLV